MTEYLRPTPWDVRNFHIDTFEVTSMEEEALAQTEERKGHYTIKIDPLSNPKRLLDSGFYYVDTLIEPVCKAEKLLNFDQEGITIEERYNLNTVLEIAEKTFHHGRFHRDFNIPNEQADKRYMNWTKDLIEKEQVYALNVQGETAGFYGFEKDKVLLLGMSRKYRGKGLARPFLSAACQKQLIESGSEELTTSISAANVASLNLFYSLGYRLRTTKDVYHKLNRLGG
ncbi:GNAT family N-acetyltransferase [Halobacillus sp. Marseille-Q1614]|uniref:GNAT family N-acetyltransferase n=1 Tax=Halobacillus sp. Marseille-Q1614 TaxID=2709134 RepID=UPI0020C361F2|nr:GNAT family N-acetyltransferase [Halobacillus sp. Marseille-Q1614]